jgi:hypothetical protein
MNKKTHKGTISKSLLLGKSKDSKIESIKI